VLLGLLLYGYTTGVFSSRKIERATYETVPFRFIAGNLHPDHDTLATFRRTFLQELKELFVQVLLLAQEAGVLKLGTISLDGTKIHADASKRKAISYKRLLELEAQLRTEVEELFILSEQSDQREVPDGLVVSEEIARREDRLARLTEAKAVLEARAQERTAAEQAEYEEKMAQRAERERTTGRRTGGRPPTPPVPGARSADQYNFTDPSSRIMKNPTDAGFEQDYNAQMAVDQASLLIVGWALSNHPNDSRGAPNPRSRPSHQQSARRRRRHWIPAIRVPQRWLPVRSAASNPTLPLAVIPIILRGSSVLLHCLLHHLMTRAPWSRWPTSSRQQWAKPSTELANAPSNRSSGSSKRCLVSVSSLMPW
jgi:hypothetical protein